MIKNGKIAGVDGCLNGWAVVEIDLDNGGFGARVVARLEELLTVSGPELVVVDIPIGFPDMAEDRGRACEREVRKKLGVGVFPSPARAALWADDILQASDINRKHHASGKGLQPPCLRLFPKMREIDMLMPSAQGRIVECHPELCFWAMNGGKRMRANKKQPDGIKAREELLNRNGFAFSFLRQPLPRPSKPEIVLARDDFLDACAAAWTARRIALGEAEVIPRGGGHKDGKGIKMEMWY